MTAFAPNPDLGPHNDFVEFLAVTPSHVYAWGGFDLVYVARLALALALVRARGTPAAA